MRARCVGALALASMSLGSASGCSALFVRPLPDNYQHMARPRCTKNTTAPVIDTLVAGLEVIRTAYALTLSESDYNGMALTRSTDILFGGELRGGVRSVGGLRVLRDEQVSRGAGRRPPTPANHGSPAAAHRGAAGAAR